MQPVRVVYDNQPYLVIRSENGSVDRAYGPFSPGIEPALGECGPENEVRTEAVLATLRDLLPISPELPFSDDNLSAH
jgi:hypothetical protein